MSRNTAAVSVATMYNNINLQNSPTSALMPSCAKTSTLPLPSGCSPPAQGLGCRDFAGKVSHLGVDALLRQDLRRLQVVAHQLAEGYERQVLALPHHLRNFATTEHLLSCRVVSPQCWPDALLPNSRCHAQGERDLAQRWHLCFANWQHEVFV
jgi:hypothetical protein